MNKLIHLAAIAVMPVVTRAMDSQPLFLPEIPVSGLTGGSPMLDQDPAAPGEEPFESSLVDSDTELSLGSGRPSAACSDDSEADEEVPIDPLSFFPPSKGDGDVIFSTIADHIKLGQDRCLGTDLFQPENYLENPNAHARRIVFEFGLDTTQEQRSLVLFPETVRHRVLLHPVGGIAPEKLWNSSLVFNYQPSGMNSITFKDEKGEIHTLNQDEVSPELHTRAGKRFRIMFNSNGLEAVKNHILESELNPRLVHKFPKTPGAMFYLPKSAPKASIPVFVCAKYEVRPDGSIVEHFPKQVVPSRNVTPLQFELGLSGFPQIMVNPSLIFNWLRQPAKMSGSTLAGDSPDLRHRNKYHLGQTPFWSAQDSHPQYIPIPGTPYSMKPGPGTGNKKFFDIEIVPSLPED
ncbi:MAG: hypothetical protein LBJ77_03225 [Holosporales bacterium]|jgi:hypothetical protein|nr:hypothetical protein [Holosporales bacterium]